MNLLCTGKKGWQGWPWSHLCSFFQVMLRDLWLICVGCFWQVGSVHVPTLMEVESYAVHSLVSTVRGPAPAAGDHAKVPASHLPWRVHDWALPSCAACTFWTGALPCPCH